MNAMVKTAYMYGVQAALREYGLEDGLSKTAGDVSPVAVGIASGLLPFGPLVAPVVSAMTAPQDRALSRAGHVLAGSLGGGLGGVFLGGLGGAGLGELIDMARDEEEGLFADHKYRNMLTGGGAILGGMLGQGLGAGLGQSMSQNRDFDYQKVRD
jgi:hypothetical protein